MISIVKTLAILPSTDSTNNYAMARVREGLASSGDVFFAMEQTAGKGQRGRVWQTEPGNNITLSVVLQPHWLKVSGQFLLSAATALGCYDFFKEYAGEESSVKWPNDIYWRDRKAGGILIENIINAGEREEIQNPKLKIQEAVLHWSVIGIGININQVHFAESVNNAVSLKQITGKHWDVIDHAKVLCGFLEKRLSQSIERPESILGDYNKVLFKRHQKARLKQGSRIFEGLIKEVNANGQLVVTTSADEVFNFGELEWVLS